MKWISFIVVLGFYGLTAQAAPVDEYLGQLASEAKRDDPSFSGFDAKRGKKIFTSTHVGKRGKRISCRSCHGKNLQADGENIFTGKHIKALSPKANPKRLSKIKKMKKWLRRNFKDVYNRDGTAREKGDVLLYIMSK
ncbi:DUF1924 domain-containing protein [Nitratifractor sp.]